MHKRLLAVVILAFSLILALTWGASAQGPDPASHDWAMPSPEPTMPDGPLTPPGPNAAALALGQPGLSYRYVQSFGQLETPYFDDSTHVNYPYGVATDGTNVWIAEGFGLRALKFSSTGLFGGQIGKAGFRFGAGTNVALDFLAAVGVDSGGNIWLVDQNTNSVFKFTSSFAYVSSLGTGFGTGNYQFNNPLGIAFDSTGNVYVSDSGNQRVQVFSSGGAYVTTIGVSGVITKSNAGFNAPEHITTDESDNLYVADGNNHRVQIFNSAHVYSATIGVTGVLTTSIAGFVFPTGVSVDANKIYVADFGNHRVEIFDRSRNYLATLGVTGVASATIGYFNQPSDVAVDSAGNIYVSEFSKNSRVQQFNSSYQYVRTFGTTGVPYLTAGYHYNRPRGVAVAGDGSMYIAEERGHRVIKLNAAGVPQWTIGPQPGVFSGCCNNYFNQPSDIALDSGGRVYVADSRNHRIQVYDANGAYYRTIGVGKGMGVYNFNLPLGVFVGPGDTLYVADYNNQRVQIFDSAGVYSATLGVTGVSGTDNAHFNGPVDVVLDGNGTLYVSEDGNQRVQVFNASRVYQRTIGGVAACTGRDLFDEFCGPHHLAVDAHNNLYIADTYPNRIEVFDPAGAYLTSIGQSFGNLTGQIRNAYGAAFDTAGNFYFADRFNHRIQKFAPGVPGWKQTNINGFGDRRNGFIYTMGEFGNKLYAGTYNNGGNGGELWRTDNGSNWAPVLTNGFGITLNSAIDHILPFSSQLYASTENDPNGGQLWRSGDGLSWTQVISQGFGDSSNGEIVRMAVFGNQLYASTWSYTGAHGTEIWRSGTGNTGDWTRVVTNGFNGNPNNQSAPSSESFNGYLYYGTYNGLTGAEVWRTNDGTVWNQINVGGFGTSNMREVSGLASFGGYLYAAVRGKPGFGAQVWRCQVCDGSDWFKVVDNGFGNSNSSERPGMAVLGSDLYLVIGNTTSGLEVWRTRDGITWRQVGFAGFGNSNNVQAYRSKALAIFNNSLFVGTQNGASGTEVWQILQQVFLPSVLR